MQTIVKLLLFCRSKEQLNTRQGKTWSSGTNLRLPFAVNVALISPLSWQRIVVKLVISNQFSYQEEGGKLRNTYYFKEQTKSKPRASTRKKEKKNTIASKHIENTLKHSENRC